LGKVERFPPQVREAGLQLWSIYDLEAAALPAPIRRVLLEAASRL